MPLGSFRLNGLGKYISVIQDQIQSSITSLSVTSAGLTPDDDISYLGNDSSNQPVFALCYRTTNGNGNLPSIILFKINNDMSLTSSEAYTLDSRTGCTYVSLHSERDGPGLRTTSGFENFAYASWNYFNSDSKVVSFSYNLETLVATFGNTVTWFNNGRWGASTYIGNRRYMVAYRGGTNDSFLIYNIATRTIGTTTLTMSGNSSQRYGGGQGFWYNAAGFDSAWAMTSVGNNNSGSMFSATRWASGTTYYDTVDTNFFEDNVGKNTRYRIAQFNNSNKVINSRINFSDNGLEVKGATINWNSGTTAPSYTKTQNLSMSSFSNSQFTIVEGFSNDESYFILRDANDSQKLKFKKITINSNTLNTDSYYYYFPDEVQTGTAWGEYFPTRTVTVNGVDLLVMAVRIASSGNISIIAIKDLESLRISENISPRTGLTVTAFGNAVISTAQSKFGGSSIFINGVETGNNALQIAGTPIPLDTRFGEFDGYTIECWTYHTAWQPTGANNTGEGSSSVWSTSRSDGYVSTSFGFNEQGKITFNWSATNYGNGGTIQEAGTSGVLNTWQHIAFVKNGNNITLYVNGTSRATGTISVKARYDNLGHGSIANRLGKHFWGGTLYIDEFRMSKVARYTSNFTAPIQPFVNDENTVVLLHGDGTNGSTTIIDDKSLPT